MKHKYHFLSTKRTSNLVTSHLFVYLLIFMPHNKYIKVSHHRYREYAQIPRDIERIVRLWCRDTHPTIDVCSIPVNSCTCGKIYISIKYFWAKCSINSFLNWCTIFGYPICFHTVCINEFQ